jgi:signal transduction histidine kinase
MGRVVVAVLVVLTDGVWLFPGGPSWVAFAHATAIALAVALGSRLPATGLLAALLIACLPGGAYALLLWTGYQAGHRVTSRAGAAVVLGGSLGYAGQRLAAGAALNVVVATYLVLVALPMVIGRYLAQHRSLVAALDSNNRRLRAEQELLGERERLRERLRIARDVHDSLGHRLGLLSVQAAALEVARLPAPEQQAVRLLARTARKAMDELHELVGTLRQPDEPGSPGLDGLDELAAEFRTAGMPVTLRRQGEPRPLTAAAGQAAYHVVEEGLTNAAKHAAPRQVTVSLDWEPDALLLSVVSGPPVTTRGDTGYGLAGLAERVGSAGGLIRVTPSAEDFRLVAMLPILAETPPSGSSAVDRVRAAALVLAAAALPLAVGTGKYG